MWHGTRIETKARQGTSEAVTANGRTQDDSGQNVYTRMKLSFWKPYLRTLINVKFQKSAETMETEGTVSCHSKRRVFSMLSLYLLRSFPFLICFLFPCAGSRNPGRGHGSTRSLENLHLREWILALQPRTLFLGDFGLVSYSSEPTHPCPDSDIG